MISKGHAELSIEQQCEILDVPRSSYYYQPKGESEFNLELMRVMDEHYLLHPYKGVPQMHSWLVKDKGYCTNIKRIERPYYKVMGLRAVAPGKHTSKRNKQHKTYPYLLRDLKIESPNQVWSTDISYIPMAKGFMYLTAIIDLYSRYVVNWSVSNTMDSEWCAEVFSEAIELHGKPGIINTDQGSQCTSESKTAPPVILYTTTKWFCPQCTMQGKGAFFLSFSKFTFAASVRKPTFSAAWAMPSRFTPSLPISAASLSF